MKAKPISVPAPWWPYALGMSEDEAVEIARGSVPAAVQNAVISLIKAMGQTPADYIEDQRQKREPAA